MALSAYGYESRRYRGTRGMTAQELTDSTKWWNGPDFLCSPEAEWPERKFDKPPREALCECKLTCRPINESSTSYDAIQQLASEPKVENARRVAFRTPQIFQLV